MLRIVAAALLLAAGYALGASGVVPDLWRELSGSSGPSGAQAEVPDAPVPREPSVAQPEVPDSSVACVEYSYERPPADQLILAQVVSITDGDTFRALIDGRNVPIRMADYDAPERDQPFGERSMTAIGRDGAPVLRCDCARTSGRSMLAVGPGAHKAVTASLTP
jgi:endonuclease YncB( thermonuclease family)